jgi:NDP-sugar pyrophosphorylase family protein
MVREPVGALTRRAFTGIHVVEPRIFGRSDRTGAFSIITLYLELAASGWIIHPLDVTEELWFDIGTPDRLEAARRQFL